MSSKKLNVVRVSIVNEVSEEDRFVLKQFDIPALDMGFEKPLTGRILVSSEAMGRLSKQLVTKRDKARDPIKKIGWNQLVQTLSRVKAYASACEKNSKGKLNLGFGLEMVQQ